MMVGAAMAIALSTGCTVDDTTEPAEGVDDGAADGADDGGAASTGADDGAATEVSYYKDIKPIVDSRCASCHEADGIAPFSMVDYQEVADHAMAAVPSVLSKTMPPWPPNADCGDYLADRSLTDEQIDLFMEWVDLGMPEGDPADEPAAMDPPAPALSRVDRTLEMPAEYAVRQAPDDYRCFLIPWPEEYEQTQYVTGFGAVPGNAKTVHHIIAFLAGPDDVATYVAMDEAEDGPGYTCFGGTGGPSRSWLGAWAPGGSGSDLPDGLGMPVEPGSMIILQVHYNALSLDAEPDRSSIQLKVDEQVDKEAFVVPFASPAWLAGGMRIPAGESDVMHEFSADVANFTGGDLTIYSSSLHMHMLGANASLSIDRADGSNQCLLQIDDWDFSWQGSYGHPQPQRLAVGDELHLQCHYDNSPENQPFVGGEKIEPQDVGWGEGTTDEMCLGVLLATRD